MTQLLTAVFKPSYATDIPLAWIANVREIILRDGVAIRAGLSALTIEVQNGDHRAQWMPLNLSTNTCLFATEQDRDQILKMLTGEVETNLPRPKQERS